MSLSDRLTDRGTEPARSDLLRDGQAAIRGADGRSSPSAPPRVGRRQLGRLRSGLSDRDIAILRSVEALHFLTTRQVERLHFNTDTMTALAAARTSRRVLSRLYELRLLDRLDRRIGGLRAGSAAYVVSLSPLGARLLGHTTRRRSREPSLAHLDHVLAVAEIVVRLHEAERVGQLDVIAVEGEPTCWRSFVGPHGASQLLKPDLRLTVGSGDQELHWFVEVDRATEHRPAIERKCRTYVQAWRDGSEQRRVGVFPRVLWSVPDEHRALRLEQAIAGLPEAPAGMFAVVTDAEAVAALHGSTS